MTNRVRLSHTWRRHAHSLQPRVEPGAKLRGLGTLGRTEQPTGRAHRDGRGAQPLARLELAEGDVAEDAERLEVHRRRSRRHGRRKERRELRRVGRAVERFELRAELVDLARMFLRLSLDGAEKRALRFELAKDVLRGRDRRAVDLHLRC